MTVKLDIATLQFTRRSMFRERRGEHMLNVHIHIPNRASDTALELVAEKSRLSKSTLQGAFHGHEGTGDRWRQSGTHHRALRGAA